jgi:hypothetical protein
LSDRLALANAIEDAGIKRGKVAAAKRPVRRRV